MESRCDTDFARKKYEKSAASEQAEDPSHYFVVNLTPLISPCNKVLYRFCCLFDAVLRGAPERLSKPNDEDVTSHCFWSIEWSPPGASDPIRRYLRAG
jgi:hypothetical protein